VRLIEGIELQLHSFLALPLDISDWRTSSAGHFNSEGTAPVTDVIEAE
jgi:hypothetical protein